MNGRLSKGFGLIAFGCIAMACVLSIVRMDTIVMRKLAVLEGEAFRRTTITVPKDAHVLRLMIATNDPRELSMCEVTLRAFREDREVFAGAIKIDKGNFRKSSLLENRDMDAMVLDAVLPSSIDEILRPGGTYEIEMKSRACLVEISIWLYFVDKRTVWNAGIDVEDRNSD